eukprot:TRINITY_DN43013_c0_g1_i1.p1 TRINITY_DN43013_c0_g1~~TRINITY_DN43013_c0_g1_i1.p1  ORF type:complete len:504 (-),score=80.49 TRINITY_DN43013_c0_g1_i1:58-1503(-)
MTTETFTSMLQALLPTGELLKPIVNDDGMYFMYMFNSVRVEEAANSISSLQTYGNSRNIVVYSMDEGVCPKLTKLLWPSEVHCIWTGMKQPKSVPYYGEMNRAKHCEFLQLVLHKFLFVALGIVWGYNVFYVDTDTVFLQDPKPELAGDHDIWIQDGSKGCLKSEAPVWEYNTGLMYWKSSPKVRRFLMQLLNDAQLLVSNTYLAQIHDDQTMLSFYLHSMPDEKLRLKVFPRLKFPNGDVFFTHRLCGSWEEDCCDVVVIHNNFLLDHDDKTKISRLKESGYWVLPEKKPAKATAAGAQADSGWSSGSSAASSSSYRAGCCTRPRYLLDPEWRKSLLQPSSLPLPYGMPTGESGVLRIRGHRGGWTPYVDLVRALLAGYHVVLEVGDQPPHWQPKTVLFIWGQGKLHESIDVVLSEGGAQAWLFLARPRVTEVMTDWLFEADNGLPPAASLRARFRLLYRWNEGDSVLNVARACQEVPCW